MNRKVAGSVAFVAKKKGCDTDVAAAVPPSLKDSIEKQMDKELADVGQAHHLVERYRSGLGKENAAALEKQASDLSRASYLVHVQIVEDKLKIARMLGEAEQIKRTADDAVAAEKAFQAGQKATDADKKASQARIEEMNKSKASIDAAVAQANAVAPKMEEEIQKLQKEYDDALAALRTKIQEKKR
jgi:chromosome segregation ATPase